MTSGTSKLYEAVLNGDSKAAAALAQEALDAGTDPIEIVTSHMAPAMDEAGRRFECADYFVPELLLSARAMKAAFQLIRPRLAAQGSEPAGRIVIGTVKGDLHDIGKNLVAAMLEGGGFEVVDLGVDVPAGKFVETVRERNADLLCLSTLLTVTMPSMKSTVQAVRDAGLNARVVVGGAPVTEKWALEIGADGYGANAAAAVPLARRLIVK